MGVSIPDECAVFCDNSAVVTKSRPESTLKKKHAAINFHRVREAIAAATIKVVKEDTRSNLADILTKLMPSPKMKVLLENILWKSQHGDVAWGCKWILSRNSRSLPG
jgi:hypothetical protein